jgi:hypothetical protein
MANKYDATTTSLFEMEVDETDFHTGEVKRTTKAKVVKKPKTPEFLMLFTAGAPLLRDARLTTSAELVLSRILEKWVLQKNRVELGTTFINHLVKELSISRSTIYTAVGLLKKRQVLVQDKDGTTGAEIRNAWYLNPYIFGKGKWNDIQKLRFDLSVEFDFVNLEASSKASRIAKYVDEDEVFDPTNYNVVGQSLEEDIESNIKEVEIVVENKDKEVIFSPIVANIENVNSTNTEELQILIERRKILELENKSKELDLKGLEFQIELKKL